MVELTRLAVLERRLRTLAASANAQWGIYVRFLDNGEEIAIEADRKMDTMSLIKVPILVALMRRVDRGEVSLDQPITLEEDHKRLGTGVLRLFGAGATFRLRDALWLMEVVSDNTATDICLEAAGGVAAVNAAMAELGIDGIEMTGTALDWFRALGGSMDPELARMPPGEFARRGYPALGAAGTADARARYHFEVGQPFSLATPRALGELLARIHARTCASEASCALMLEILAGQQLRSFIPRFVWGAGIAHKTGNFEPFIASDIAIATPWRGPPVVMCFLTGRFNGQKNVLEDCLGRMAELVVLEAETR
ncbi:serine hydrolase [Labrys monachus]|uniref:beta-lactamase n=1 Tax=Labrys monachus TaxID=217067 RepID=A0ABU0FK45_9HYPH|nr:serine hydrolase [Labrys monachus]MDQ0394425.1 beta-lactamase class A [Labrys monachus]